MSIVDDYAAIQERQRQIRDGRDAPIDVGAGFALNPTALAKWIAEYRKYVEELDASPELQAHADGKLREGVRDWSKVNLIKHPDGSYALVEPEPPPVPPPFRLPQDSKR